MATEKLLLRNHFLKKPLQMFVVAPLLLYPMYWLSKRKHLGLLVWLAFLAVFTAVPWALSMRHELPPGLLLYLPVDDFSYTYDFYNMPWCR